MYLHAGQLEDIKLSILQGYKFPSTTLYGTTSLEFASRKRKNESGSRNKRCSYA